MQMKLAFNSEEDKKMGKSIGKKEGLQELTTGQEFIYNGVKIALTKYELTPTHTVDKNLLWVYLYVENIDDVPHYHIYDMDFVIYHNKREDSGLSGFGLEEGRKYYSTGSYNKLNPGEVREGWIDSFIPTDWKAEDIEIHFKPMMSSTQCIWLLK